MTVFKIDIYIELSNLNDAIRSVLTNLRPQWDLEKLKMKKFSEGTINTLVGCYCRDEKDMVVFRINILDLKLKMIDRKRELHCAEYLSSRGLAPKMLAIFQNGFCYQFFSGIPLNLHEILDERIYSKVARLIADFHSCKPNSDEPLPMDLFDLLENFPPRFPKVTTSDKFPGGFLTKAFLQDEQEMLRRTAVAIGSPVVFCHRDLTPLNILYEKTEDTMLFIDFEFAANSFQAFDLAFYFTEYCGVHGRDPSRFPGVDHRKKWLTIYAERFAQNNGQVVTEKDIDELCQQVQQFVPMAHFVTSLVTLAIYLVAENETDDGCPGSQSYTVRRFEEYFESKSYLPL